MYIYLYRFCKYNLCDCSVIVCWRLSSLVFFNTGYPGGANIVWVWKIDRKKCGVVKVFLEKMWGAKLFSDFLYHFLILFRQIIILSTVYRISQIIVTEAVLPTGRPVRRSIFLILCVIISAWQNFRNRYVAYFLCVYPAVLKKCDTYAFQIVHVLIRVADR